MRVFALMLVVVSILSGCASVQMGDPKQDAKLKTFTPPADKVGIYVYRPNAFVGSAVSNDVSIDGNKVGSLIVNTYVYIETSPGKHIVSAGIEGYGQFSVIVNGTAGTLVFVSATATMSGYDVKIETDSDGKVGVQQCALAATQDVKPNLVGSSDGTKTGGSQNLFGAFGAMQSSGPPSGAPVTPPAVAPALTNTSPAPQPSSTQPLSPEDQAHYDRTLATGHPSQLYFLAGQMDLKGHSDLAGKLYQALVDKYPDDPYTAKAISKLDAAQRAATSARPAAMSLPPQNLAQAKEQHDACIALCASQSQQCNAAELGNAAPSAMQAFSGAASGNFMDMMSGLGNTALQSGDTCEPAQRACNANCPSAP